MHAKFEYEMSEEKRLKNAMGCFATGVTVVSTHIDGIDYAMTCNSFNTVSLDPPMVLWSIRRESSSCSAFLQGTGYTVSVLAQNDKKTALQFTKGTPEERYAGIKTKRLESGRLINSDSIAWFDCVLDKTVEAGDHFILIGRVIDYSSRSDKNALVYFNGTFASLS